MKRLIFIYIFILALFASCSPIGSNNPYEAYLNNVKIQLVYPDGLEQCTREGVPVLIEETGNGNRYLSYTDSNGSVGFKLTNGNYRIVVTDKYVEYLFNANLSGVKIIDTDREIPVNLSWSKAGEIIIKEIYCGGCPKYPAQGVLNVDNYVILHNNTSSVQYLDSLCFGTADPYNSTATNVWITKDEQGNLIYPSFVPVIQAVWQFPGNGQDFPLQAGEDAVICVKAAIDHTMEYPLSINLNNEKYFVCYNNVHFPNVNYHPTPGDKIDPSRILNVVTKLGTANAYTFSINSPAVVIFKTKDISVMDYINTDGVVIQKPSSDRDKIVKVPNTWIMDGVEVFTGGGKGDIKRLASEVDAGYVSLSATGLGYALMRKVDEEISAQRGYEVLQDSNNSSNDFVQTSKASLYKEK